MSTSVLILLGDGPSKYLLDDHRRAYPDAPVWTLNRQFVEGAAHHFDIHFDRSQCLSAKEVAYRHAQGTHVIVSPFREDTELAPGEARFPLRRIFERWGVALFERTLDYMLALALHERALGMLAFDRLVFPGHDLDRWPHFGARSGPHFWLGLARGQGIALELPQRSALLQRRPDIWRDVPRRFADLEVDQPHMYGQPREVTAPLAAIYGWKDVP